MFICNHCPYVIHIAKELRDIGRLCAERNTPVIAISSNDVKNYPQDAPELMTKQAQEWEFSFPYLYDEFQQVARGYQAACTPDFFLYNSHQKLEYRGQLDGSRPGNDVPVTGDDLRAALSALWQGEAPLSVQKPSMGCNIKWLSQ